MEDSTIVALLQEGTAIKQTSEAELFQGQQRGITTSSKRLDQLFGPIHGIPRRGIVEFTGASGCGKTQLCISLALNVQLSFEKGGLDGQCIYIDTEGGLMVDRVYQMAEKGIDYEQVQQKLSNIIYYRVLDHVEMIALVRQLPDILQDSPKVKLLIVDSVAYHLRLNIRQNRNRLGLVNFIGETLAQMATRFNLAVVVTSHISTDVRNSKLRPALGETWAQWCTKRLMLTRKRQQRYASIYDSSQQTPYTMEPFIITEKGIEDADEETLARMNQWRGSETKKEVISPDKARHQGKECLSYMYDSEDIWNEHGGFTDELLSEIPSIFLSIGSSIDDDDDRRDTLVPDSLLDTQRSESDDDSTTITASVIPPTATPYHLSQTQRRKQASQTLRQKQTLRRKDSPQSPDSTTSRLSNNKKARHDQDTNVDAPPAPVDIVKDDQSDDDWGPESDELWLAVAELTSPSG